MVLRYLTIPAFVGALLVSVFSLGRALTTTAPAALSRSIYGVNPFAESAAVADFIRQRTASHDRIAVLGSEPQIHFYAGRRPATEHIYMYGLMEHQPFAQRMQDELIAQIEGGEPPFLVVATARTSWLQRPDSERKIFLWMKQYVAAYYEAVLVADIQPDQTRWLTGKDAASVMPEIGPSRLIVYERKHVN